MVGSWDASLETGIEKIDRQHRQLFEIIKQLDELKDEPKSDVVMRRMLDKLMDFTIAHFSLEEDLMTEVNYPPDPTKAMVDEHHDFKTYLQLRSAELREAGTFEIGSFLRFLEKFLKTHEFGLDRQLADWILQQNKISRAA